MSQTDGNPTELYGFCFYFTSIEVSGYFCVVFRFTVRYDCHNFQRQESFLPGWMSAVSTEEWLQVGPCCWVRHRSSCAVGCGRWVPAAG